MESYTNVVFYNNFHNGDVHLCREFVKYIIKNIKAENYYFLHPNSSRLLLDIIDTEPPLEISQRGPDLKIDANVMIFDEDLYINTWIGRYGPRPFGCTLDVYYRSFEATVKELDLPPLASMESYIPVIDFTPFQTDAVDEYMNTRPVDELKIFICNSDCHSGQAVNFDMSPAINKLCEMYPEVLFLVTNESCTLDLNLLNLKYTRDVIKLDSCDLPENGYVSTYCDIIVGRCSGAFCFAILQQNLNKPIISFTKMKFEGLWLTPIRENHIHSTSADFNTVIDIVSAEISKKIKH